MKKYIFLVAFCVSSFVHGNGFDNLKNIQNQFHALIYQAGGLGATQPAPEVPYIAGLLRNPTSSINGTPDACSIYGTLYDRSAAGGDRKAIAGIDQAKADAFDALSFDDFARYDRYQNSGHSVLGVAAQEIADPVSRSPSSLSSSASLKSGGDSSAGGGRDTSGMLGQIQAGRKLNKVESSSPKAEAGGGIFGQIQAGAKLKKSAPVPVVAAAPSLLERVQAKLFELETKKRKSSIEQADIAILSELEAELSGARVRNADEQARYDQLVDFCEILTSPSSDHMALLSLTNKRNTLKSASVSPVVIAGEQSTKSMGLFAKADLRMISASNQVDTKPRLCEKITKKSDRITCLTKELRRLESIIETNESDESDDFDDAAAAAAESQESKEKKLIYIAASASALEVAEELAVLGDTRGATYIRGQDGCEAINERIINRIRALGVEISEGQRMILDNLERMNRTRSMVSNGATTKINETDGTGNQAVSGSLAQQQKVAAGGGKTFPAPKTSQIGTASSKSLAQSIIRSNQEAGGGGRSPVVQQQVVVLPTPQSVVGVGGGVVSEIPVDAAGVKTYLSALLFELNKRNYGGGSKQDQIAYLEDLLSKLDRIETSTITGGSIRMTMKERGEASAEIKKVRDQINPALIKLQSDR